MTMPAARYPAATWRPVSYREEAGQFAARPIGWILHVVVGNGSPWGTFERAVKPYRRFSTLWVSKTGLVEQYTETGSKSWAQSDGNATYWSVETEGFPSEPLTAAQIQACAKIHVFLGAADALAEKPGQPGIGTHYMGGSAWGGHTCPDPASGAGPRSRQRGDIIRAAQALRKPTLSPTPTPIPQEDEMTFYVQQEGEDAVFVSDGIFRRELHKASTLATLRSRSANDTIIMVKTAADLDEIGGVLVGSAPPAVTQ